MITNIQGISENRIAPLVERMRKGRQALVITTNSQRAKRIATDLSFFCDAKIYVLPDFDPASVRYEAKSRSDLDTLLNAYAALLSGENCIAVAPALTALKRLQPREVFGEASFEVSTDREVERDKLVSDLVMMGYERVSNAEAPGQFAVRGDIVDVFACSMANPVRIELFDTEVDSIRSFDALTQRSIENLDRIRIFPAQLVTFDPELPAIKQAVEDGANPQFLENYIDNFYRYPDYVWNYMDSDKIFVDDPSRIKEVLDFFDSELVVSPGISYPRTSDFKKVNDLDVCYFTPFAQSLWCTDRLDKLDSVNTRPAPIFSGHMDMLESELKGYLNNGYEITVACGSTERYLNLKDYFERVHLDHKVKIVNKDLSTGTEYVDEKKLFLSEGDIFRSVKKSRKKSKNRQIKAFTDINKGDYIVHDTHGIGQFMGVERKTADGSTRDYLKIQYAGADVLYIPVDQMESIQKYVGSESNPPKISKLSGGDWQITKAKAKASIKEMAAEFLKATAERQLAKGFAFAPDSQWQKEFEDAFPYAETEDQLRCTEEIKKDMQSETIMDRLLCGDVGYGKTEVAARAIFKALEQGKQVAVLVPTTILASQHYHSFKQRFAKYPFVIDMLCRFRSEKEQDKTVADLKKGDVDLVIGTHRLLSSDVEFKDLGLLVIDEEQRFGVEHKEKIKRLKAGVDVLTLSATPIPRTLHMSLIGIRNMSVIEEPPEERYPVQTYVTEQDDRLICDAVRREVGRGGQVYLVYNRVRGINQFARHMQELMPEIRFRVGHGQMAESVLEDTMIEFSDGKADVLISTTIIETGLDIPNVNTLIIIDADRFGLAQLYQLRGRVGRSNRMAYAYLMYKKDKVLTEVAEKRLRTIREFTEFGSGFRIAMRDLELRGAGNLLGVEQSGHMISIGYEMYCKMVEEAVAELSGQVQADTPIESDTAVELGVSAFLPEFYVSDELTRLDMYKRIASVSNKEERIECFDELVDRFGDPPQEVENLLDVAMIRNKASRLGINKVVKQINKVIFLFDEKNGLTAQAYAKLVGVYGPAVTIYAGSKPRIGMVFSKGRIAPQVLKFLDYMG